MVSIEGTELNRQMKVFSAAKVWAASFVFPAIIKANHKASKLIQAVRRINPNILIAVDQEGGVCSAFGKGFLRYPL